MGILGFIGFMFFGAIVAVAGYGLRSAITKTFNYTYLFDKPATGTDHAFSPALYNKSENQIALELIGEELKENGFNVTTSTRGFEFKKTILFVIFAVLLFISSMIDIFRLAPVLAVFIRLVAITIMIVVLIKFRLKNTLLKQVKNRETEDIGFIVSSMVQDKITSIPFVIVRVALVIFLCMLPYIIFNKPTFLYEASGDGYAIRYYVGLNISEKIEVPETYKGKPVVGIRGNVFKDLENVKEIVLPDTITYINGKAFMNDKNLTKIKLPSSLTILGGSSFRGCESLEAIEIPEGVTEIGGYSFYGDVSLTSVKLPSTLERIGGHAFENCYNIIFDSEISVKEIGDYAFYRTTLKSIKLQDGLKKIGAYTFYATRLSSIDIPASVEKIGESAFEDCISLTSVTLHDGLKEISESAFKSSGIGEIVIPDTVTKISAHAFQDCTSLKKIKLSRNITEIKAGVLRNTKIESIVIPEGVTRIGERAFRGCANLEYVEMPTTVKTIEDSAFRECFALKEITIPRNASVHEKAFKDTNAKIIRQ